MEERFLDNELNLNEISSKGLKFRKRDDDQIIVEVNGKTEDKYLNESVDHKQLMLHNFMQMERFCHRIGNEKYGDDHVKPDYRCYIVVKNFSNNEIHIPGRKAEFYNITQDYNFSFKCIVYANGKYRKDKGFVYLRILKDVPLLVTQKILLSVSVIDSEGNDKFTQSAAFYPEEQRRKILCVDSFRRLICRKEVLRCPLELLHCNHLILCINMEIEKDRNLETENEIKHSFEIDLNQSMHVLSLETDIGRILCKNSMFFQKKSKETQTICMHSEEVEDLKNICRLLMAKYLKSYSTETIFSLYKAAHIYQIPLVINYCRLLFKKHASYSDDASELFKLVTSYNDVDFIETIKSFQQKQKKYDRFVWHAFDFDCAESTGKNESGDSFPKHIHYASGEYLQCDNNTNMNQLSFNFRYEEIEKKFKFCSAFNIQKNGEITLPLHSDFGKILCEKSNVLKKMFEYLGTETQEDKIKIREKDLEAFKNLYRLLMGGTYIKATTIDDIISLYEICDFYDIPSVMNTCRKLFEKHICVQNSCLIKALSKKCRGDDELAKIVKKFQAEFSMYLDSTRCHRKMDPLPKWSNKKSNNFVELEDFQYDFYQ